MKKFISLIALWALAGLAFGDPGPGSNRDVFGTNTTSFTQTVPVQTAATTNTVAGVSVVTPAEYPYYLTVTNGQVLYLTHPYTILTPSGSANLVSIGLPSRGLVGNMPVKNECTFMVVSTTTNALSITKSATCYGGITSMTGGGVFEVVTVNTGLVAIVGVTP